MSDRQRIERLAAEVMELSRNAIVLNLRFMDMAVFRLRAEPADCTLATDGRSLFYGPEFVLRRYLKSPALPPRDTLHALLHCVFRHPFIHTLVERERWDLAADIAVESLINSLELDRFAAPRQAEQQVVAGALAHRLGLLTAEKLYRYFGENPAPEEWKALFAADDHALWHKPKRRGDRQQGEKGEDGKPTGGEDDRRRREAPRETPAEDRPDRPRAGGGGEKEESPDAASEAGASSRDPVRQDEGSRAFSARQDDDRGGEAEQRALRSEAGGDSGEARSRKEDGGTSEQQNTGRGLDTEGGDSSTPVGAQSRNDRTDGGADSPSATGVSGDSGDARSQGGASPSGGSGSGLDDTLVQEGGEAPGPADLRDYEEQLRESDRQRLEREWREAGERIRLELEAQSRQRGEAAGELMRRLEVGSRTKTDYAAFLRKFAVLGEHMQLNDDEFDQVFYTYGLRLYGNLPLIEPLETREVKRVREFVVAIDTSGSTSGALVERFLTRTWEILQSEESFFRKINLHILQCDSEIQEHARITNREEFDRYMQSFSAKGLGGTDFRPVFRRVDELLRARELTRLRGLIYFTDGQGVYPERKPDYETAFAFVEPADGALPEVPPWAMRVVLDEDALSVRPPR